MSADDLNPYAQAASAYGTQGHQNAGDQRQMEAQVLLKSARRIQELHDNWPEDDSHPDELEEILKHNRQIWMMFYDTAVQNPESNRPAELRSNIINLANFIFKREADILATPDKSKLPILVSINRDVAAGLMGS